VDNVSWSILLDDIETACRQLRIGRAVELPVVTAGYGVWCEHQLDLARSGAIDGDLAFWLAQTPVSPPLLLPDLSPRGANLEALAQSVAATLTKDETDHLLHGVTVGLDARVIEVLLAALVLTAREINGAGGVHLALEGHGREGPGDGLDVSRSVGWFTALFPVRLETPLSADGLETLGVVKQVLRSLPANGTTYGLLRHLLAGTAASEQLAGIPWPVLLFNYLGRAGAGIDPGACLRLATPGIISSRGAGNMRTHAHIVTAVVADSKLLIQWEYPGTLYRRATIETFVRCYVRQLRSLLELAPRQPRP
jgi:non-ribosomal peptide synthase protein (TIGR01720 family)